LDVYCETSPLGEVRIRGSFNEVLRPGWEKTVDFDLISHHVLANATVTIQQAGRVVLSSRVGLVYWEGE